MYTINVPNYISENCTNCGETFVDNRADAQTNRALRGHLGLLHPEELKRKRKSIPLTQAQLSELTCISAETLSRIENDHIIQSRAHDKLLRVMLNTCGLPQSVQNMVPEEYASKLAPISPTCSSFKHNKHSTLPELPANGSILENYQYALAA
jgi:transcriptional regulator with XRE-family HTH domain